MKPRLYPLPKSVAFDTEAGTGPNAVVKTHSCGLAFDFGNRDGSVNHSVKRHVGSGVGAGGDGTKKCCKES